MAGNIGKFDWNFVANFQTIHMTRRELSTPDECSIQTWKKNRQICIKHKGGITVAAMLRASMGSIFVLHFVGHFDNKTTPFHKINSI